MLPSSDAQSDVTHLTTIDATSEMSFQNVCFLLSGATECQDTSIAHTITVSQSGGANFTTLTDAFNSIPSGNNKWIKILLNPGIYKEQIIVQQDKGGCIILEGSDLTSTIITYDNHSSTLESVTLALYIDNFVARNVTFKNSFRIGALLDDTQRTQAVALRSYGDKHAFYSCGFVGYQDTLWDDHGRHYFKSCYIEGAVDFIFGNGQSVYEQCTINVTGGGYITAQSRPSANDTSGYVFRNCDISGTGHAELGRVYGAFARVIFIDSKFSKVVDPEGWFIWNQSGHENDVTFAEVNCTGPGADTSKRVSWEKKLDSYAIRQYDTQTFINQNGWIAKQPL
ncbi:probable pectinesterase 55 [Chenopodium quinoa]|uniref:probable pectinesterase 55 n=1 Tax=Chenopodium quinoa TaxID=63459 RepID=UPI000B790AA6|nr:probable pectinesterase 55 [Chenopodium quinoa]